MISALSKTRFVTFLLGIMAGIYFGLVIRSMRWQRLEGAGFSDDWPRHKPVILVHWHNRLLGFPAKFGWRYRPHYLISSSRDGNIALLSGVINGIHYINGSTDKGGAKALLGLRRLLKKDQMICITPDGPRGPARMATNAAIILAASSGAPIVPFSWSSSRHHRQKSWDRLMVPTWFSRGVYAFGEPIYIHGPLDEAAANAARLNMEDAINAVTAATDLYFHHPVDHLPDRYGSVKKKC
ncbi:MAG: DUF374 domain-containing protein [Alphaproteobacteria bacterium]|nr:DUF374 domain-containing protein [Alphaproteobacteria bacterium]